MPGRFQRKTADSVDPKSLADFKVGVDNVIFSVDTAQNRLLVLLLMVALGKWNPESHG